MTTTIELYVDRVPFETGVGLADSEVKDEQVNFLVSELGRVLEQQELVTEGLLDSMLKNGLGDVYLEPVVFTDGGEEFALGSVRAREAYSFIEEILGLLADKPLYVVAGATHYSSDWRQILADYDFHLWEDFDAIHYLTDGVVSGAEVDSILVDNLDMDKVFADLGDNRGKTLVIDWPREMVAVRKK